MQRWEKMSPDQRQQMRERFSWPSRSSPRVLSGALFREGHEAAPSKRRASFLQPAPEPEPELAPHARQAASAGRRPRRGPPPGWRRCPHHHPVLLGGHAAISRSSRALRAIRVRAPRSRRASACAEAAWPLPASAAIVTAPFADGSRASARQAGTEADPFCAKHEGSTLAPRRRGAPRHAVVRLTNAAPAPRVQLPPAGGAARTATPRA